LETYESLSHNTAEVGQQRKESLARLLFFRQALQVSLAACTVAAREVESRTRGVTLCAGNECLAISGKYSPAKEEWGDAKKAESRKVQIRGKGVNLESSKKNPRGNKKKLNNTTESREELGSLLDLISSVISVQRSGRMDLQKVTGAVTTIAAEREAMTYQIHGRKEPGAMLGGGRTKGGPKTWIFLPDLRRTRGGT